MSDPVKDARTKKNEAKNYRRESPPKFEEAETALKAAISILEEVPLDLSAESFDTLEKSVALELADCWGSLGGTYRAWGKLYEAFRCYEKGLSFEADPRLPANSYNLVNLLMVRFAMNPIDQQNITQNAGDINEQLKKTRNEVARQAKGPRKGDMWVYADYALLSLLSGDRTIADEALKEFDRFAVLEYAYTNTRSVLSDLAGRDTLTADQHEAIQFGVNWFDEAIKRRAWDKKAKKP